MLETARSVQRPAKLDGFLRNSLNTLLATPNVSKHVNMRDDLGEDSILYDPHSVPQTIRETWSCGGGSPRSPVR